MGCINADPRFVPGAGKSCKKWKQKYELFFLFASDTLSNQYGFIINDVKFPLDSKSLCTL